MSTHVPTLYFRSRLLLAGFALLAAAGTAAAATLCVNPAAKSCYSTIGAAVSAAHAGDVIQVARGTYKEDVLITKSLSLVAAPGAQPIIDATGLSNAIFVNGMAAAPSVGVGNVIISGFAIRNANFEGLLIANANDVTVAGNHVSDNNQALEVGTGNCPGIPAFETNEGDDCGEGIHLMGVIHSTMIHNEVDHNSGGMLISDETGPTNNNLITGNYVHDNPWDCGITIASHGPATSVIPTATISYGITHTTVSHNLSQHNGAQLPGAGAGVGIFAPFPGTTAAANVVIENKLIDNGLPGVTMHNHASAPSPAPPINLNNNVIVGNYFSGNAADTEDAATSGPTGINLYSTAPVYGTLVSQNVFDDEAIDVAFKAPGGQVSAHFNNFSTGMGVDNLGAGAVDATENWWHCSAGPVGGRCSTVSSGVWFTPWLTFPFDPE